MNQDELNKVAADEAADDSWTTTWQRAVEQRSQEAHGHKTRSAKRHHGPPVALPPDLQALKDRMQFILQALAP